MRYSMASILLAAAISMFQISSAQSNSWYEQLPSCPCRNPDQKGVTLHDGWAKDKGNIGKYHKGAAASYRSYPPMQTEAGRSGQQCCYDGNGNLITAGRGAGTPDKTGTCKGENKKGVMITKLSSLIGHFRNDVKPWMRLMKNNPNGWQEYNAQWPPNNGNYCIVRRIQ